tara:strand:- start:1766 stop:2098 length:333 start_codon:yes stop_codon:yes gene_type:complete
MIKLKKLIKEDSVSPSFRKMIDGWHVLEDILGPTSQEYFKLIGTSVFKKWWSSLKAGDPQAIKLFPTLVKGVENLMNQRNKKMEKEVKDHIKRNAMHLKRFASMGKGLKI